MPVPMAAMWHVDLLLVPVVRICLTAIVWCQVAGTDLCLDVKDGKRVHFCVMCMYTCVLASTCVPALLRACVYHGKKVCTDKYARMHARTHARTHVRRFMHARMHAHMCARAHVCTIRAKACFAHFRCAAMRCSCGRALQTTATSSASNQHF